MKLYGFTFLNKKKNAEISVRYNKTSRHYLIGTKFYNKKEGKYLIYTPQSAKMVRDALASLIDIIDNKAKGV